MICNRSSVILRFRKGRRRQGGNESNQVQMSGNGSRGEKQKRPRGIFNKEGSLLIS